MSKKELQGQLELLDDSLEPSRPDRMCVSVSDLHLTDGSVGYQNLGQHTWDAFYGDIVARCQRYCIKELYFILDGDIVDLIRTDKWAKNGIYPWQREDKTEFSRVLNEILKDIVADKHVKFFDWLKAMPQKLKDEAGVDKMEVVVLLGNHDKELICDDKALSYFYEKALGRSLKKISEAERRWLGRMYGDEEKFLAPSSAPYLPFYFADRGFRFFTTHGQWRDATNNRSVKSKKGPGWTNKQGWKLDIWQKLEFSPFTLPCLGDVIAAGLLSTFIYEAKQKLAGYNNPRLLSILDEMDLYRPTTRAPIRLLEETKAMRKKKQDVEIVRQIEDVLFGCFIRFIDWCPAVLTSRLTRILLKVVKAVLIFSRIFKIRIEIRLLKLAFKIVDSMQGRVEFKEAKLFPAFMPEYQHYGFQIHGEGHTHVPLEEEFNFGLEHPATYINFGTWRDQIVSRKKKGYRRRSILRALYILDLNDTTEGAASDARSFNYYTQDILHWSDKSDNFNRSGKPQPHV